MDNLYPTSVALYEQQYVLKVGVTLQARVPKSPDQNELTTRVMTGRLSDNGWTLSRAPVLQVMIEW